MAFTKLGHVRGIWENGSNPLVCWWHILFFDVLDGNSPNLIDTSDIDMLDPPNLQLPRSS